MTHSELLDAIQGFDVMIINGSRNPFRELREFTVKGHTIMAYSRKDAITRLKLKKKI